MLATVLCAAAGCGSDNTPTAPRTEQSCGTGSVVTLAVAQGATFDCAAGTDVVLAGNGASYLVVPQFATGDVPNQAVSYVIGGAGAATTVAAAPSISAAEGGRAGGDLQTRFDAALRTRAHRGVTSGAWRTRGGPAGLSLTIQQAAAAPALNSVRDFRVIASLAAQNPTIKTVSARLRYVGTNVLLYVDTLAPANGLSSQDIAGIGPLFDQTLYPLDVDAFGPPSDIDQNGHLIMLMTPVVNALTPAAECGTQGFVAGFFDGFDLANTTSTDSNKGEIFYTIVPDPAATVSCAHTVAALLRTVPATFLHEVQHLISFSQHVVVHGGQDEQGWLDEGLSLIAEELGSRFYEKRFPPPTGRTNPAQLFPDSAQGYISELLVDSDRYLHTPANQALTLHSDADAGLLWRGGDWLLMRWLGDQKGDAFFKRLDQSTLTGTANIAAVAGEPFPVLFGDFSLAVYTDSLPGIARDQVPPRLRFLSRNLRLLYDAVFRAVGPSAEVPQVFPITVTPLSPTTALGASMVPGTMSFYRLDTPAATARVTFRFGAPGGGALAANLHPQVSVFRLPSTVTTAVQR